MSSLESSFYELLLIVSIGLFFFWLVVRGIVMWYYKINIRISNQEAIISLLRRNNHLLEKILKRGTDVIIPDDREEDSDFSEISDLYIEKEYYSNGKIKLIKSFNSDQQKHGFWEYYEKDGSLDYKEYYENGKWVKNVR